MKLRVSALFALVFVLVVAGHVLAQSQMSDSGTNYASATMKAMPIDKDHMVLIWDQMGMRVDDSGKGPFHNMATHLAMIIYIDKGVEQDHGYLTDSDKDGDKLIWEIWAFPIGSRTGKGKVIGATGKFEGMEGTMDYVLQPTPKSFPDDSGRTVAHEVIKYTLKKPLE